MENLQRMRHPVLMVLFNIREQRQTIHRRGSDIRILNQNMWENLVCISRSEIMFQKKKSGVGNTNSILSSFYIIRLSQITHINMNHRELSGNFSSSTSFCIVFLFVKCIVNFFFQCLCYLSTMTTCYCWKWITKIIYTP